LENFLKIDLVIAFVRDWMATISEKSERQRCWIDFFDISGIKRSTVAAIEEPLRKLSGYCGRRGVSTRRSGNPSSVVHHPVRCPFISVIDRQSMTPMNPPEQMPETGIVLFGDHTRPACSAARPRAAALSFVVGSIIVEELRPCLENPATKQATNFDQSVANTL
jgi:hypothetical protein